MLLSSEILAEFENSQIFKDSLDKKKKKKKISWAFKISPQAPDFSAVKLKSFPLIQTEWNPADPLSDLPEGR